MLLVTLRTLNVTDGIAAIGEAHLSLVGAVVPSLLTEFGGLLGQTSATRRLLAEIRSERSSFSGRALLSFVCGRRKTVVMPHTPT